MTKIEQAIAVIRDKGSIRTPELATKLGTSTGYMTALLGKPVEDGYLVACKVSVPGCPPVNEYRLSASIRESKVTWAEFKASKANALHEKPLKKQKARPPRVPASAAPVVEAADKSRKTQLPPKPPSPPTTPAQIAMPLPAVVPRVDIRNDPITVSSMIKEAEAEAERSAKEVKRWLAEAKKITFMIGCDGCLRLQVADLTHTFTKEQTCAAGDLLTATQPIWSHA